MMQWELVILQRSVLANSVIESLRLVSRVSGQCCDRQNIASGYLRDTNFPQEGLGPPNIKCAYYMLFTCA